MRLLTLLTVVLPVVKVHVLTLGTFPNETPGPSAGKSRGNSADLELFGEISLPMLFEVARSGECTNEAVVQEQSMPDVNVKLSKRTMTGISVHMRDGRQYEDRRALRSVAAYCRSISSYGYSVPHAPP